MIHEDPAPRLPTTPGERGWLIGLALLFGAALLIDFATDYTPTKLSIVFMLLAWAPLLVVHELGHACAAHWLGWRVNEISIGMGRQLLRWRWHETVIRIRTFPVSGYVLPSPRSSNASPLRAAWIYASGPLAELYLVGACWLLLGNTLLERSDALPILAVQATCVIAVYGAVTNLLPLPLSGGNVSDGLGVIRSLRAHPRSLSDHVARPFANQARRALDVEDLQRAERALAQGRSADPNDPRLESVAAVARALAGDPRGALRMLEQLDAEGRPESGPAVDVLVDTAWVLLLHDADGAALHAQQLCERARSRAPSDVRCALMLGRSYIERGRYVDAYQALMQGYKSAEDPEDEAQFVAYLALACRGSEQYDLAERFVRAASQVELSSSLRARLRETFPDAYAD